MGHGGRQSGFNCTGHVTLTTHLLLKGAPCSSQLWGRFWKGQVVIAHCDNSAAVEVTNAGYSKDAIMMHLF